MNRIDVKCSLNIYEIDGEDTKGLKLPQLEVESHWNEHDKVTLVIDGRHLTVVGSDLIAAVQNAQRTR